MLLLTCTTEVPFHDHLGNIYVLTDRVSMGSVQGPILSNFYMSDLENKTKIDNKRKPSIYLRYVKGFLLLSIYENNLIIVLPIVCCFVFWRLGRPHWGGGNADGVEGIFRFCRTRVGSGPASGSTLKKGFCRTCPVVGRRINKIYLRYVDDILILANDINKINILQDPTKKFNS